MQIAASMSVGRLAPKHSLDIDGIRAISPNVTPSLIKDDVVIIDRLKRPDGSHMTIEGKCLTTTHLDKDLRRGP